MPSIRRQAQCVRLGLLQMLQPVAQVRPESQSDLHGCASLLGGLGLMTISRPMIVHTRLACWQISSSNRFAVMFLRRTVILSCTGAVPATGLLPALLPSSIALWVAPGAAGCTPYVIGYEMTCMNLKCRGSYEVLVSSQYFRASSALTFSRSTSGMTDRFRAVRISAARGLDDGISLLPSGCEHDEKAPSTRQATIS